MGDDEDLPEVIPEDVKEKYRKPWNALKDYFDEFFKGIGRLNPIFVGILGLCPTLAVTTSIENGVGMGFASWFVLVFSEVIISSIRNFVPNNVRIPVNIVIIAIFVTIASMALQAFFPELNKALGLFVFLIVVNCTIFGRAEVFASKKGVFRSFLDGMGMGIGFSLALILIGGIREIFGTGKIIFFGSEVLNLTYFYDPMIIFILAPGALLTVGFLLAAINYIKIRRSLIVPKIATDDEDDEDG